MAVPAEIVRLDVWVMCATALILVLFARTGWRISRREAVSDAEKSNFQPINAGKTSNLQTAELSQPDPVDTEQPEKAEPAPTSP